MEQDIKKYLTENYKLLGCYESIADSTKRKYVELQCDKAHCGTYHNGAKISVENMPAARINKEILRDKDLRACTGYEYLIVTLVGMNTDGFGKSGFKVKNLRELLYSSVHQKQCMSDRLLKELLQRLETRKWIELVPDKNTKKFEENKIRITKKLKNSSKGYIEFYYSIVKSLIDGKINQIHYLVFITLLRNLANGKNVTYDQLSDDLAMDKQNVGKYVRKLQQEHCLFVQKIYTEKGIQCNRYRIISPEFFDKKTE